MHLKMQNMLNLDEGPQKQKTTLDAAPVSQKQDSETTVDTGLPKLSSSIARSFN